MILYRIYRLYPKAIIKFEAIQLLRLTKIGASEYKRIGNNSIFSATKKRTISGKKRLSTTTSKITTANTKKAVFLKRRIFLSLAILGNITVPIILVGFNSMLVNLEPKSYTTTFPIPMHEPSNM